MEIKVYNTLSGKKEPIGRPRDGKTFNIFVCGPTVYDFLHIGNARTFAFFDTFVKYLRSNGKKVFYLQNITDVDDKIIDRAKKENKNWKSIAKLYENIFKKNMRALRITAPDAYARATDHISEIVSQVQILIKKRHAYKIENGLPAGQAGGWYFDIKSFPGYGKLAKRTVEQAEDGISRIDTNSAKKNRGDFCLWKLADARKINPNDTKKKILNIDGEPVWPAPFGWGRPGWHIEDTAITEHFFGPQYDIHGAARDLIFPHHEAEIAQAESASGKKPFVKIWMHVGFLTAKTGKKMSKSLNNFLSVEKFLKENTANVFRFMTASANYRSALEYSEPVIKEIKNALINIEEFLMKLSMAPKKEKRLQNFKIERYEREFASAMNDDLNTPKALAAIFNALNEVNKSIWQLSRGERKEIRKWLSGKLAILGISIKPSKIPQRVMAIAKKRELFRSNKQFGRSDALRKEIEQLGYKIEDTPLGPLVLKKS